MSERSDAQISRRGACSAAPANPACRDVVPENEFVCALQRVAYGHEALLCWAEVPSDDEVAVDASLVFDALNECLREHGGVPHDHPVVMV